VNWPVVIKADGLCAGKGVFLAPDAEAAKDFIARVMEKKELGSGGNRILLEETLEATSSRSLFSRTGRVTRRWCRRGITSACSMETGAEYRRHGAYSTDDLLPEGLRKIVIAISLSPPAWLAADAFRIRDSCTSG